MTLTIFLVIILMTSWIVTLIALCRLATMAIKHDQLLQNKTSDTLIQIHQESSGLQTRLIGHFLNVPSTNLYEPGVVTEILRQSINPSPKPSPQSPEKLWEAEEPESVEDDPLNPDNLMPPPWT